MLAKLRGLARMLWDKYKQLPIAVKASLWFMACSVLQKGMSFITTPIFTRVMTTEQFGEFTMYTSWSGIVAIFITLNLQAGSFNTAQVKYGDDRNTYTSSVQGLVTIITLIGIGIFAAFGPVFEKLLKMPISILLVMLVHIWGQFSASLWLSNRRFDYKYKSMIALTLTSTVLIQVISLICVLNFADKGTVRILSLAAVDVALGIGIFIYNQIKGKKFFVGKYWKFALGFNLPLIPYYLSQLVFSTSDRIMIDYMVGTDKAGIYGLAHNIAFLLTFVISAIRNSYTPNFFQKIKSNDSESLKKSNLQIMFILAAMLLLFIFVAPELLMIMGGQAYYEAVWIIPPLIAGLLFEFFTDFSCNILFFHEKKWILVLSTIGCAVVNVALNYIGIKFWGYTATAYATLICYILFWLALDAAGKAICKKNDLNYANYLCTRQQTGLGLAFLLLVGGCMLLYVNSILRYSVFALILIVLFLLRKRLIPVVKTILPFGK